jgi:hypothetical protein
LLFKEFLDPFERFQDRSCHLQLPTIVSMDTAIDLSDPAKALDLANIRFQLM